MKEPMAYAVYRPPGSEFDYIVFIDQGEGWDEIHNQDAEGVVPVPDLIPLFAGKPIPNRTLPREIVI